VVAADCAIIDLNIPSPQSYGVPFLYFESFLRFGHVHRSEYMSTKKSTEIFQRPDMKDYIKSKLSGHARLKDEQTDSEHLFELICRTDQVMHFFEHEIDSYLPYVSSCLNQFGIQDSNTLDHIRHEYADCVMEIYTSDLRIADSVERLVQVRSKRDSVDNVSKAKTCVKKELEVRESLEAKQIKLLTTFRPLINSIKLAKLRATDSGGTPTPSELEQESTIGDTGASPQKHRHYTVEEVRRILASG
jgi:hypothetical protein